MSPPRLANTRRRGRPVRAERDLPWREHVVGNDLALLGQRHVQSASVRRQGDAVRGQQQPVDLADRTAVRRCIPDRAGVERRFAHLAEVAEPESSGAVEHKVVGSAQRHRIGRGVERRDGCRAEVDALDRSAAIAGRQAEPHFALAADHLAREPAVVGDVACPIGADRCAIGSAAGRRHQGGQPIGHDARELAFQDFDDHHRSVGERDRPFGCRQPVANDTRGAAGTSAAPCGGLYRRTGGEHRAARDQPPAVERCRPGRGRAPIAVGHRHSPPSLGTSHGLANVAQARGIAQAMAALARDAARRFGRSWTRRNPAALARDRGS